jgi:hypothetical protein
MSFVLFEKMAVTICNSLLHPMNILISWLLFFSFILLIQTSKGKNEISIVTHVLLVSIMRNFFNLVICNDDRIRGKKQITHYGLYVKPAKGIKRDSMYSKKSWRWKNLADYFILSEIVIFIEQKGSSSFLVVL